MENKKPSTSFLHRLILNQNVFLLVIAIFIGVLGGYGALLFRYIIRLAQYGFYQETGDALAFLPQIPFYIKILMPAVGGLIVGPLVYFGAREAKGHGVPEVMEAVALETSYIVSKPLKKLKFPKGALLAGIMREDQIIIPTGETVIVPDDRIIIVARREAIPKIEKILAVKLEFF